MHPRSLQPRRWLFLAVPAIVDPLLWAVVEKQIKPHQNATAGQPKTGETKIASGIPLMTPEPGLERVEQIFHALR